MISKDKTYRTRDGREVRIYATDVGKDKVVHGVIMNYDDTVELCVWSHKGRSFDLIGFPESPTDLIEVKPRHKRAVWLNVHPTTARVYSSKGLADIEAQSYSFKDRIACIRVDLDFEEGEGL